MTSIFTSHVEMFNKLYNLPVNKLPTIPFSNSPELGTAKNQLMKRLRDFKDILVEELGEVNQILEQIQAGDSPAEVLTEIADWLGDIQIYCASEMLKFGLDNDMVLDIIMASNMSKLGADGKPVYSPSGKVLKGPGYWQPQPQILRYIITAQRIAAKQVADK